jgi:hypothetical protein
LKSIVLLLRYLTSFSNVRGPRQATIAINHAKQARRQAVHSADWISPCPRAARAKSADHLRQHTMIQRRTDERTALATEYALFLAETRGVNAGLVYLESCNVSREILLRAMQDPAARRVRERRQRQRND